LGPSDISVNSEIWDGIVDWVVIFSLGVEILTAFGTVADWVALNKVVLIKFNISLPEWSKVLWGIGGSLFAFWVSE